MTRARDLADGADKDITGTLTLDDIVLSNDMSVADNGKVQFGAGNDLQIYHDGSNSVIKDNGTGKLILDTDGTSIEFQKSGLETLATFNTDGAITLYHDNSAKLATASTGVSIPAGQSYAIVSDADVAINRPTTNTLGIKTGNTQRMRVASNGDISFYADNGTTQGLFWDASAESLGIGTTSPGRALHVKSSNATVMQVESTNASIAQMTFVSDGAASNPAIGAIDDTAFNIQTGNVERMRIDSSGNLLVGTTDVAPRNLSSGSGIRLGSGSIEAAKSSDPPGRFNRTGSDGEVIQIRRDGTSRGRLGIKNTYPYVGEGGTGLLFEYGSSVIEPFNVGTVSARDDAIDLGGASVRFDDIRATNGTIQTSDQNDKQQIASLTSTEITAAKAISALFKTYKWNKSVTANGDAARTHTGVIAQEVQAAMSAVGLDATKYAFWCSDTWWEHSVDVAAVEADEEAGIEARDAYTRIDTYKTADEAPEGATERTRLGIRYPELLAFVGAATEQRLADIEARLTSLEAAE